MDGISERFLDDFAYGRSGWGGVDDDYRFACRVAQRGERVLCSDQLSNEEIKRLRNGLIL
jgi:hypothetical protein